MVTRAIAYHWQAPSPIARAEVEPLDNGYYQVRLFAQPGERNAGLLELPRKLHQYGLPLGYADVVKGENALVISHVKQPDKVLNALKSNQYVQGDAQQSSFSVRSPAVSMLNSVRRDSLKWSGRTGLVGHAALVASGAMQGDWNRVIAGPLGASTAGILARYGNGKGDIDFDGMLRQMNGYFEDEGISLPDLSAPEQKKTILQNVDNIIGSHPIQIAFSIGSLGALKIMQSALRDMRQTTGNGKIMENFFTPGMNGRTRFLAGSTSLLGNLVVLLVPEMTKQQKEDRKNNPPQPHTGLAAIPLAAWDFIRESPLRFNGLLNLSDNAFYLIDAMGERKKIESWKGANPERIAQKEAELAKATKGSQVYKTLSKELTELRGQLALASSWKGELAPYFSLVTAFSFAVATTLSMISSKNRNDVYTDHSDYEKLFALVTRLAVELPPDKREDMLTRMSTYLSSKEELREGGVGASELIKEVHKRIELMENSPWLPPKDSHMHGAASQPTSQSMTL